MNKKFATIFLIALIACIANFFYPFTDYAKNYFQYATNNNIHAIRTIEPNDSSFSDLDFLMQTLDSCDIVLLGEQQHGDGSTFEAKSRIINYLHSKMGFEVLAFEAGLEDCSHFLPNKNSIDSFSKALYPFWGNANQTFFLRNQLISQENPLLFTGFDFQWTGQLRELERETRILAILHRNSLNIADFPNFSYIIDSLNFYTSPIQSMRLKENYKENILQELAALTKKIKSENENDYIILSNVEAYLRYRWCISYDKKDEWRDKKMAENIIWLKEKKYPTKKVILWAANMHGIFLPPKNDFYNFTTMGQYLKQRYGKRYYTLSFTSFEGSTYNIDSHQVVKINESATHSLEYYLNAQNIKYGFIDFRQQSVAQKKEVYCSKILGHGNHIVDWSNATDGLFFIHKMQPAIIKNE